MSDRGTFLLLLSLARVLLRTLLTLVLGVLSTLMTTRGTDPEPETGD